MRASFPKQIVTHAFDIFKALSLKRRLERRTILPTLRDFVGFILEQAGQPFLGRKGQQP